MADSSASDAGGGFVSVSMALLYRFVVDQARGDQHQKNINAFKACAVLSLFCCGFVNNGDKI